MSQCQACDLCGLEVGARPFCLDGAEGRLQFCCEGCLGIYQLLHEPVSPATPDEPPTSKGEQP